MLKGWCFEIKGSNAPNNAGQPWRFLQHRTAVVVMEVEVKGSTEPYHILLEPYAILVPGENYIHTTIRRRFTVIIPSHTHTRTHVRTNTRTNTLTQTHTHTVPMTHNWLINWVLPVSTQVCPSSLMPWQSNVTYTFTLEVKANCMGTFRHIPMRTLSLSFKQDRLKQDRDKSPSQQSD